MGKAEEKAVLRILIQLKIFLFLLFFYVAEFTSETHINLSL